MKNEILGRINAWRQEPWTDMTAYMDWHKRGNELHRELSEFIEKGESDE